MGSTPRASPNQVLDPDWWKRFRAALALEETTKRHLDTLAEVAADKQARATAKAGRTAAKEAEAGGGGGGGVGQLAAAEAGWLDA